jgi:predicted  nucleic acid-binding Zn-ribbon protein
MKFAVLIIPAFLAGIMSYYALHLRGENQQLLMELNADAAQIQAMQEQLDINAQQREMFENQILVLQNNLQGTQSQLINLSAALQDARESIREPNTAAPAPEVAPQ